MTLGRLISNFTKALTFIRGGGVRLLILLSGGACGPGLRVERGLRVRQGFHPGIRFGSRVYLGKDTTIDCPSGGSLNIGNLVTLTHGVFLSAAQSVTIGNNALIGEYSSIRDANHAAELGAPIRGQPLVTSAVVIGEDVWVGRGAAILAGVEIGAGAIVGANAVVTRDVSAQAIVGGVPARLLRQRNGAVNNESGRTGHA